MTMTDFLGRLNTHPLTTHRSDRDSMTEQRMYSIKVKLGEPMNFIGVPYRSMGEGPLNMIRSNSRTAVSPQPTPG